MDWHGLRADIAGGWRGLDRDELWRAAPWLAGVLVLALFLGLRTWTARVQERVEAQKAVYARVESLNADIAGLRSAEAPLGALGAPAAGQRVLRELGLERRVLSMRPMDVNGKEGVSLVLNRLNLPELADLLHDLTRRGGLAVSSLLVSKRGDDPRLVDVQMVLGR